jgi:lambda family phage portal protein
MARSGLLASISNWFGGGAGYDAAGSDRPETAGWQRNRKHVASSLNLAGSDPIAARAEDEDRNNPWVNGALDRDWESVVGAGLQPWPTPMYRLLGKGVEWSIDWSRLYRDLYRQWAEDPLHRADALMRESYGKLEAKARLNFRRGGEVLVEIRRDKRGAACPINLLLIDPARLDNPTLKGNNDPNYRGGIEYQGNVPVAAWIRPFHPDDKRIDKGMNEPIRVPFRSKTGMPKLLFISYTRFIEQVRGVSPMASSMIAMKMLASAESDVANRVKLEAQMGVFVQSDATTEEVAEMIAPGSEDGEESALATVMNFRQKNPIKALQGLFVRHLVGKETVKFMPPVTPGDGFVEFRKGQLSQAAASQGLSLPEMSQNYDGINLSNMRAIRDSRWRIIELERLFWAQQFSQPINLCIMEHYVSTGEIKIPGGPKNFYKKLAATTNTTWIGPDRGTIDAEKEARADSLNAAAYRVSPYESIISKGRDPDEILDQTAAFHREIEKRKLPMPDYNTKGSSGAEGDSESGGGASSPNDGDGDGVLNEADKKKAKPKGVQGQ